MINEKIIDKPDVTKTNKRQQTSLWKVLSRELEGKPHTGGKHFKRHIW